MEAGTVAPTSQAAPPPRLREHYEQEILPALTQGSSATRRPMQVPRLVKITLNMGLGEAKAGQEVLRGRQRAAGDDRRPAAERAAGAQVGRLVQASRGDAGRRLGHPAPRPDVGVPRPPGERSRSLASATSVGSTHAPSTAAATTRSASASRSSSPRSTTTRSTRCVASTSRSRPPRSPTSRLSNCCSRSASRSPRRAARARRIANRKAEEEEQRKDEAAKAELRAGRAGATKEENPEAYAKPETDEGEGGDADEGSAEGGSEESSDG